MGDLSIAFRDHEAEILAYLDFLDGVDLSIKKGHGSSIPSHLSVTPQQQKILYSSVYLQLYNLVEATVTRCLDAVTDAAFNSRHWSPKDLCPEIRKEWVRTTARTHTDLNYQHRLDSVLELCNHLLSSLPIEGFKMERGGGGNWDDGEIEVIVGRLGFKLTIDRRIYSSVKRRIKDDLGPLGIVKKFRNSLAHGEISFTECGQNVTVGELRNIATVTASYMSAVVQAFETYIDQHEYLLEESRPPLSRK